MNTTGYRKLLNQVRTQFAALSKEDDRYNDCLRMLEFARKVHTGVRKDGVTKEFYHQLSIVGVLLTQHRNLQNPHLVYQAALGHDVIEDYPEHKAYMQQHFAVAFPYCWTLSKKRNGLDVPYPQYFGEMAACPVASAVKLIDRLHNLSTMLKVFKPEKQVSYVEEVDTWFLPMAKTARENFPRQRDFYELAKCLLNDQCSMLRHFLGMEKVSQLDDLEEGAMTP
ncbi:hypothetical protein IFT48_02155 [Pseudomonas fluorescens]|uniref:hypothetical protein n=1 Tax=Pseudomonas TaxID=286 RepID=UPI00177FEF9D|nr:MULTISPECIES: hypothetical protein [Pseudomonas]MBD8088766.1 hypothetical protein [Pseudomonas fluorescens]MBD8614773.1 hypothetical protein [Pseudomonas putida]MBD8681543.1 hypothetical protein [Pseudomonas sp. CFBP 13719]